MIWEFAKRHMGEGEFSQGWMSRHPALFLKREVYLKFMKNYRNLGYRKVKAIKHKIEAGVFCVILLLTDVTATSGTVLAQETGDAGYWRGE